MGECLLGTKKNASLRTELKYSLASPVPCHGLYFLETFWNMLVLVF